MYDAISFAIEQNQSVSVIENAVESFLDFASTCVVLYRLSSLDALLPTARNEVIENRTSVILGLTMVSLATVFVVFGIFSLIRRSAVGPDVISLEVALATPSAVLYLVIGMLQLQMSWTLGLRSLKQDAIISILGSLVAMGTLISALATMTMCAAALPRRARDHAYTSHMHAGAHRLSLTRSLSPRVPRADGSTSRTRRCKS